jgi:hypothetical protein
MNEKDIEDQIMREVDLKTPKHDQKELNFDK